MSENTKYQLEDKIADTNIETVRLTITFELPVEWLTEDNPEATFEDALEYIRENAHANASDEIDATFVEFVDADGNVL
jgi:hypothetical protein